MASVSVLPQTVTTDAMASRRPLTDVPNAVNSPYRSTTASNNAKRTRAQAGDAFYGQPPAKKQIIEIPDDDDENVDPQEEECCGRAHHGNKLEGAFHSPCKPRPADCP